MKLYFILSIEHHLKFIMKPLKTLSNYCGVVIILIELVISVL